MARGSRSGWLSSSGTKCRVGGTQHAHGAREVQQPRRRPQHAVDVADVVLVDPGVRMTFELGVAVRDDDRIVIHVSGPSRWDDLLGDLVYVPRRGQPGPEVEALVNALLRQEDGGAPHERTVRSDEHRHPGVRLFRPPARLAVRGEVHGSAEPVVVHARDVRLRRVDRCHRPLLRVLGGKGLACWVESRSRRRPRESGVRAREPSPTGG